MFRKFSTASKPIYSVKEYINQSKEHVNRELDMQSYAIKVITGMMMSGFAAMYLHVDKRFEQVDKRFEQVDKRFEQVDKRFEHLESEVKDIKKEVKEIKSTLNDILLAVTPSKKD
jgi:septal ring factor EnvC (AmiA/AmiB activator)